MPPVRIASVSSGPRLTVNQHVKQPRLVAQRVLQMLDQKFVAEQVLRNAGSPTGGAVKYYETPPLFADNDMEIVAERGEIPVAQVSVGEPTLQPVRKRGLAIVISDEMRRRNEMDELNRQLRIVRNTLVRGLDGVFISALLDSVGANTAAATAAWSALSGTRIRYDIARAKQQIVDHKRGFNPDTLLVNPTTATDLEASPEFTEVFRGAVAGQNPALTGSLPPSIAGLRPLVSYSVPAGQAFILERNTVGGYADEKPLSASEVYYERPRQSWRSDVTRNTAVFVDEPLALYRITGV